MLSRQEPPQRFVTERAREAMLVRYGWSFCDWMQDWPLEITAEINIDQCIADYDDLTDDDEKFLLMVAILYRLDDLVDHQNYHSCCKKVSALLTKDFELHKHTIYYWTMYGTEDTDDGFNITPLMRNVWHNRYS
jgi:hypothetical protein